MARWIRVFDAATDVLNIAKVRPQESLAETLGDYLATRSYDELLAIRDGSVELQQLAEAAALERVDGDTGRIRPVRPVSRDAEILQAIGRGDLHTVAGLTMNRPGVVPAKGVRDGE